MTNHSISSRANLSRAERNFIMTYMPAAFAAGALIGSILMMAGSLLRVLPEFLGFSLHGLGFALAIATVAIVIEQNSASYRAKFVTTSCTLRDARRRCLLTAAALGGLCPALVTALAAI